MNQEHTLQEAEPASNPGMAARAAIALIRCYQVLLGPIFGGSCRFYPTCSAYWISAIQKYGCIKGVLKGIVRLGKCHPFHPGGIDFA